MALVVLALTSCTDRDSEGLTRFTTYAVITMQGDDYMVIDKGAAFADPGVKADLGGEDVSADIVIKSDVDTSKSGVYSVSYSYTNADGFSSAANRTVVVLDPNDPVEGFWYTDPSSYRLYNGNQTAFGNYFEVLIINDGHGTYTIDDVLAGWYGQRAGYGAKYYMGAVLTLDGDNNLDCIYSYIPGWSDGLTDFADGKFDPEAGTITYMAQYVSGMQFFVTLTK